MAKTNTPSDVRESAAALCEPKAMRRGSLSERYMKCGQKSCRCHDDTEARHGPYYSLTRGESGRTRSRYLSAEQAAVARQQVQAGQQFRDQVEGYWQACERWADAELEVAEVSAQKGAKKGASKKPSTRKSSPRSRHS